MYLWILCAGLLLFVIYFKQYKPLQKWKQLGVTYIKPMPIFGNLYSVVMGKKTYADWLQESYNSFNSRYIGMYSFTSPALLIKDLNLIKQLGIRDFDHFVDHLPILPEDIDPLFGNNLAVLTGHKWRSMRSTLSPAFTGSKMRSMFVLMSDCADKFVNYFKEQADPNKPMVLEMKEVFTRLGNDVIATCAFGIQCDSMKEKNNEFYIMGKELTDVGGIKALKFLVYNISPLLARMLNIKLFSEELGNFFRNIVKGNIKSREENGIIRPDLIHLLMEARKGKLKHDVNNKVKDEDAGFATVEESDIGKDVRLAKNDLSDDEITAQALIFFGAGFDTVSTTMCYMAYELALNEDVQRKLQNEIDDTLKECEGKITYEVVSKMKYLDMVLSEALRKWPPASVIDRICHDSYIIPAENPGEKPIKLHKNDSVWFPIYALHRDPQYFPNPDKFDPERFSDENKRNIKPLSYIPFGVGPRNCIGSRFALLEAKVTFVYMLSKFSFEICEKSQIPIKVVKGQFSMHAENGYWLALKLRTN